MYISMEKSVKCIGKYIFLPMFTRFNLQCEHDILFVDFRILNRAKRSVVWLTLKTNAPLSIYRLCKFCQYKRRRKLQGLPQPHLFPN